MNAIAVKGTCTQKHTLTTSWQVLRASQDQFEKANNSLISRIKELEFKLVTRESRPEDLERIAQLEKEVAEKVSFTIAMCPCTLHMHEMRPTLHRCFAP